MSYLHRTKTHLSLAELDYSQEEKVLKVGRRTLSLDSAWVETQSPWSLVPFDGPNQLEQASVCLNPHTKPLGTPGFHEWMGRVAADNAHFEEVRAGTVEVMRSVLVRLEPSTEMPETEAGARVVSAVGLSTLKVVVT